VGEGSSSSITGAASPPAIAGLLGLDRRDRWQSTGCRGLDETKLFAVDTSSAEYEVVRSAFARTMPHAEIDSIQRVENGPQHEAFSLHFSQVAASLAHGGVPGGVTRMLFHGTGDEPAVQSIVHGSGFQVTLSGSRVGALYGEGTYFARDASYSNNFACILPNGQRQMLAAEVVVGRCARGSAGMRQCPLLPRERFKRFNSLVDNEANPSIFVVQNSSQAYPAYLITYH
jgi:poly [ADP-ribose] polymerase 7/11/12/13